MWRLPRRSVLTARSVRRAWPAALQRREPWGVWGGQLFVAGAVVAHKRPSGRPRKYPIAEPFAPAAQGRSGGMMREQRTASSCERRESRVRRSEER